MDGQAWPWGHDHNGRLQTDAICWYLWQIWWLAAGQRLTSIQLRKHHEQSRDCRHRAGGSGCRRERGCLVYRDPDGNCYSGQYRAGQSAAEGSAARYRPGAELVSLQRGIFSSDARYRLVLVADDADEPPLELLISDHIEHGPWP